MCLAFSIDNVVLCMFSKPFKTYRTAHNLSPGNLLCASYVVFVLSSLRYFTVGSKLEQLPAALIGTPGGQSYTSATPRHCQCKLLTVPSVYILTVLLLVSVSSDSPTGSQRPRQGCHDSSYHTVDHRCRHAGFV